MDKKMKKALAFLLALALLGSLPFAGTVFAAGGLGIFTNKDKTEKTDTPEGSPYEVPQLTEDDIIRMNNGDCAILYSSEENGYITFLRGKYYDKKVTDMEEGIESLRGIQNLLGITKGSEFFCVYIEEDPQGYTFYTYQQRYGNTTIENAVLKIIVDPDGYTAGLVSSFTPNVGFAPETEFAITPEQAMDIVKRHFPDLDFQFYPEATRQTSMTFGGVAYHVWAIYTNIPKDAGYTGDLSYLEHLVAYDGSYMTYTAVASPTEFVKGDNVQIEVALSWFENKEPGTYTGEVTLHDGTRKTLTVPVVRDTNTGMWYLADLQRHILVTDCYAYITSRTYDEVRSEDNTGWPDHYLLAYSNYIKVYDFYDNYGMHSVDGFGMPILILKDLCDENHNPIDNANFKGFDWGWALFGSSAVNDYGECVDVIGHEFTHAVTYYIRTGDIYENETGALNEAFSDIMGNLCEMILGETDDTEWLIAENCGEPVRSMSFPWLHKQPVRVGGEFYQDTSGPATMFNDFGGVHTNSSLVNHVAWQLYAEGMSMPEIFLLFRGAMNLLTPYSGFREIHQALLFAAEMQQMDVLWLGVIDMLCEQAGY